MFIIVSFLNSLNVRSGVLKNASWQALDKNTSHNITLDVIKMIQSFNFKGFVRACLMRV